MEDLTADEWDELMSVEENHGRSRVDGTWHRLDSVAASAMDLKFEYIVHVPIHGTRTSYNEGCRCKSCKRAERDYRRLLRSGSILRETNPKEE